MNPLPVISHHLFVAAIGNVGHVHEKPGYQKRPFSEAARGPAVHALALGDEAMPLLRRGARPLQMAAHQARA